MAKRRKNVPGQGTAKKLQFIGNTPSEETFDILYQRYSKAYDSVKGKLRAGQQMYLTKRNKRLKNREINKEKYKPKKRDNKKI